MRARDLQVIHQPDDVVHHQLPEAFRLGKLAASAEAADVERHDAIGAGVGVGQTDLALERRTVAVDEQNRVAGPQLAVAERDAVGRQQLIGGGGKRAGRRLACRARPSEGDTVWTGRRDADCDRGDEAQAAKAHGAS